MGLHVTNPARIRHTSEGGIAIRMTNKTGAATVKGTVLRLSSTVNNAVIGSEVNSIHPIGVMYDSGIADGSECWVVVAGRAQVLLKNDELATRGHWVGTADVIGRAYTALDPPSTDLHRQEIGHCMETVNPGGTDKLFYAMLHFN